MTGIDFRKKLRCQRPYHTADKGLMHSFESDRGRIIHSAAIRRLQQKTQVFPLERNAAVRSRLTHSLEVQQTGRYIAKRILEILKAQGGLAKYGLEECVGAFESVVEMACLLHDVGNPPFGHFGESAIRQWFNDNLPAQLVDPQMCHFLTDKDKTAFNHLNDKIRMDLCQFEGNAQAIRLVHSILQLNLTYSQVACILKYTAPAWLQDDKPAEFSELIKKPGYYLSEEDYINELRLSTDMAEFHRFPLTYIMEAADDISYCIADLDDAVEKAIFTVDTLYGYLQHSWGTVTDGDIFSRTIGKAWEEATSGFRIKSDQFFMTLRVKLQSVLVKFAAKRFTDNLAAVFAGNFNSALLEDKGEEGRLLNVLKSTARKHVFIHPEVEQLELQGVRVIKGLLEIYNPLLLMSYDDFTQLIKENSLSTRPIETRLLHKMSGKHRNAYQLKLKSLNSKPYYERLLWERYYRARLLQDYISGMTDLFAWDEYRRMMAVE